MTPFHSRNFKSKYTTQLFARQRVFNPPISYVSVSLHVNDRRIVVVQPERSNRWWYSLSGNIPPVIYHRRSSRGDKKEQEGKEGTLPSARQLGWTSLVGSYVEHREAEV